jgi:isopenicillin N synthase-like dioxygenase
MSGKVACGRIPVVDFRAFSIVEEELPSATDTAVQELAKHLYSACSSLGFVYLTNHGISQNEVNLKTENNNHFLHSSYVMLLLCITKFTFTLL